MLFWCYHCRCRYHTVRFAEQKFSYDSAAFSFFSFSICKVGEIASPEKLIEAQNSIQGTFVCSCRVFLYVRAYAFFVFECALK